MVENYVEIMAQMSDVPVWEEERLNHDSPKLGVNLKVEIEKEEQPSTSAKGIKRHKITHIQERVRSITLQTIPRKSEYFADIRQNYL